MTRRVQAFFHDLTTTAAGSIAGFSFVRLPPATGRSNGEPIKTAPKRTAKSWRGGGSRQLFSITHDNRKIDVKPSTLLRK